MWDTKHRPLTFADVLGQEGTVQVLKARLANGTGLDTSYIFSGGSGQGKTTLARIFARSLLCQQLDKSNPEPCNKCENCLAHLNDSSTAFVEQDAASQGNIEQVRRIVDELPFAVFGAPKRIYLFDECHRMSKDAQDVLLKPLEERKLVGMFCTTEPEKVRGAIRSRCEEYGIRKVTRENILVRMKRILEAEKVEYEEEAVLIVIDSAKGHVRDVISRLEMISQVGPITVDNVRDKLNFSLVPTYYTLLLKLPNETREALALVDEICGKVTAEEAANGLAEAAMNSFRLANGMMADFTFVDRELSKKVSELYGSQLTRVAEYFLRSRYITQVGLICDLATLAQSLRGGASFLAPQTVRPSFQPLVVSVPAAAPEAVPPPPADQPSPIPVSSPPAPSPPPPPLPVEVPLVVDPNLRSDGVGNLGSSDVGALTDLDTSAVPRGTPARERPVLDLESRASDGRGVLTPTIWRKTFEESWLRRGSTSEH
jgi:DNA polymerase III subunit gamma/tau